MESLAAVHVTILFAAAIVLIGVLTSLAASRFGVPLLLVFLVVGMLAGEDGPGGIAFNDYRLTYLVGSLALAIILFDGGLRTRLGFVRPAFGPAALLATLGVLITTGITAGAAMYLLDLSRVEALLVGAIVASTDAAVVFFVMRTGGLRLKRRIAATLELESGTNDPFAVLLTMILVEIATSNLMMPLPQMAALLGTQAVMGLVTGVLGGFVITAFINRASLPSGLHPIIVVTGAIFVFGLAQSVGGSGFLAAYAAGLTLGNRPVRAFASITSFHDTVTWLCQIVLFTLLGLLVTPSKLVPILLPAIGVALVLMLIARPLAVTLCLLPFRFSLRETVFVSWVGLRGGVSIFLAAIPTLAGAAHADLFFNVAFVVVAVSLLLQGWSITYAARKLGVALRETTPEVQRVEIDLPGQLDYEMVGYPVRAGTPASRVNAVPKGARVTMVVRDNTILEPALAGELVPGDYCYVLVPPSRLQRLDRFFAVDGVEPLEFPELPLDGHTTLGVIAELYDVPIDRDDRSKTIHAAFTDRLSDVPQPGDHIKLGTVSLVAHTVVDSQVKIAGLLLQDAADVPSSEQPTRMTRFKRKLERALGPRAA